MDLLLLSVKMYCVYREYIVTINLRGYFREALSAGEYVASWCWFVLIDGFALGRPVGVGCGGRALCDVRHSG